MIKAKSLSYTYGGNKILRNCNVEIQNGKLTALIGKNGSGKSTLLRCLSAEIRSSYGSVLYKDEPVDNLGKSILAKKRAVFSQTQAISFGFTVEEIITMGRTPHISKKHQSENNEIVEQCLELLDLENLRKQDIRRLSGGERQRVHIARVIAQLYDQKPEECVYFFDEPTNNLDIYHQYNLMSIFRDIAKQGFAVCVVLHDLNIVSEYADHTVLLDDGKIYQSGITSSVLNEMIISDVYQHKTNSVLHPSKAHKLLVF